MSLRLYWKPTWMTSADAKRAAGDLMGNGFMMSNERLEKILTEAYERGKKDGHLDSMRDGVVKLGEAVRERIARWPLPEHEEGRGVAAVPSWDLEHLLDEWNVPVATAMTKEETP